jgi:hypothetical protein
VSDWSEVDGLRVSLRYWRGVLGDGPDDPMAGPVPVLRSDLRKLVERLEVLAYAAGLVTERDLQPATPATAPETLSNGRSGRRG